MCPLNNFIYSFIIQFIKINVRNKLILLPVAGLICFVFVYYGATLIYPGGNYLDKTSAGFNWEENYWCNLLDVTALNGRPNAARPVAIFAMFLLCFSLGVFWFEFPKYAGLNRKSRLVIQYSWVMAVSIALLLITGLHDVIINISGAFVLIALIGTLAGLYRLKYRFLFWWCILNCLLIGLNNYIYYTGWGMSFLPVVQKLTFLFCVVFVMVVCITLNRASNR
ncbi:MAG TPA: hypothetical protein VM012_04185 [Flavitalea sp.]|nr:hypothetical protein [Flavitalea sp.]